MTECSGTAGTAGTILQRQGFYCIRYAAYLRDERDRSEERLSHLSRRPAIV